jgi:hypothetical protein
VAPSVQSDFRTVALRFLAALDLYEAHVTLLVEQGWDPVAYLQASSAFEQLRALAARLPDLRVPWVDVLVTRFEVAAILLDLKHTPRPDALLAESDANHRQAIAALRAAIRRQLGTSSG